MKVYSVTEFDAVMILIRRVGNGSKSAKIIKKRLYYPSSHRLHVNVMLSNMTFFMIVAVFDPDADGGDGGNASPDRHTAVFAREKYCLSPASLAL